MSDQSEAMAHLAWLGPEYFKPGARARRSQRNGLAWLAQAMAWLGWLLALSQGQQNTRTRASANYKIQYLVFGYPPQGRHIVAIRLRVGDGIQFRHFCNMYARNEARSIQQLTPALPQLPSFRPIAYDVSCPRPLHLAPRHYRRVHQPTDSPALTVAAVIREADPNGHLLLQGKKYIQCTARTLLKRTHHRRLSTATARLLPYHRTQAHHPPVPSAARSLTTVDSTSTTQLKLPAPKTSRVPSSRRQARETAPKKTIVLQRPAILNLFNRRRCTQTITARSTLRSRFSTQHPPLPPLTPPALVDIFTVNLRIKARG
ncbi:hypothetical protein R3P38DRAFT_3283967 [Favolaschia claudopus]|uniref:Uncharacterized protein n=1 Tax=Favolaschia claudopus TaxID=2862362 RepID=A0AAW0A671_9AGAR